MVVSERRLSIPNNPITGILLAIPGYFFGVWLGTLFGLADDQNTGVILGYILATLGFLTGVGFLNYPLERLFGWRVQPISDPAEAAVKLLKGIGAEVLAACFIIDLPDLGGADKLRRLEVPVRTLISFEGH